MGVICSYKWRERSKLDYQITVHTRNRGRSVLPGLAFYGRRMNTERELFYDAVGSHYRFSVKVAWVVRPGSRSVTVYQQCTQNNRGSNQYTGQ